MCFSIGLDCGGTLFGIFFHAFGTRETLFAYSCFSGILLASLLCYLKFCDVDEYEKLPDDDIDDDDIDDDGDDDDIDVDVDDDDTDHEDDDDDDGYYDH